MSGIRSLRVSCVSETYPCALPMIFLIVLTLVSRISGVRCEPNSAKTNDFFISVK